MQLELQKGIQGLVNPKKKNQTNTKTPKHQKKQKNPKKPKPKKTKKHPPTPLTENFTGKVGWGPKGHCKETDVLETRPSTASKAFVT